MWTLVDLWRPGLPLGSRTWVADTRRVGAADFGNSGDLVQMVSRKGFEFILNGLHRLFMSNLRLESIFVTLTSNLLFSLPSLQYLYDFSMVSGLTSARINGSLWNFQNTFLGVWNDFLSNITAGQGPILSLERQNLSKFRLYKYGSRFRKPSTSHWRKRCIKTHQNAFYRTVL